MWLGKRLAWMVLTLWIVFTISFFLMRSVPGGPFDGEKAMPDQIKRNIKKRYHLDKQVHEQYGIALYSLVTTWRFGPSLKMQDHTVDKVIAEGFPVSSSLGIFAMVFALTLGTTSGVVSAVYRNSWLDVSFMSAAILGIVVPNFVLASLAVLLFVFQLQIFPAAGWGSIWQLILPSICLGAPFAGYIARLTRTGMMEVLSLDYIRTAHAKGLSERRVVTRHALRGAILPVVSYLGPAVAAILTGSLVIERIFALPGMGTHFVQGALQRDLPLAMGMVLVYTFILFTMNTLVDISYAVIDPRVKLEKS